MNSVPVLAPLIATARERLGLGVETDWWPTTVELAAALEALAAEEPARAVHLLVPHLRRSGDEVRVTREVVELALGSRLAAIEAEIRRRQRLKQTATGEVQLLNARLAEWRPEFDWRMARIALLWAALILPSLVASLRYFGLPPLAFGVALLLFGAAVVILLQVDWRRQQQEAELARRRRHAQVAEELQILGAEAHAQASQLAELGARRNELLDLLRTLGAGELDRHG